MKPLVCIEIAKTNQDLEQILSLQNANHVQNLTAEEKKSEGFVTVKHDMDLLRRMSDSAPQIIVKKNEVVVGYALVMFKEFSAMIPALTPMFDMFKKLSYKEKPLDAFKYYVMGQICIAEEIRGQGFFEKLYLKHKEIYSTRFDICLTEVSVRNTRSMKAHEKVGFQTIHTYKDELDNWNILIWDWNGN